MVLFSLRGNHRHRHRRQLCTFLGSNSPPCWQGSTRNSILSLDEWFKAGSWVSHRLAVPSCISPHSPEPLVRVADRDVGPDLL